MAQPRYSYSWQSAMSVKTFPIEEDEHLLAVLRYVERNALQAASTELGSVEQSDDEYLRVELVNVARRIPKCKDWHFVYCALALA